MVPLVLLHGFGGIGAVWRPVVAGLDPRLPVLAPDLPGHGGSLDTPAGGAGRMAKAVLADLDQRGITQFHLCGHSLGGAVAALIALRNEDRVRSLTLLAPGGFGPEINADALAVWRDAAEPAALETALAPMAAWGFRFSSEIVSALAAARARPGAHAALCEIYGSLFDGAGRQGCLPVASLGALSLPVSILWGTADGILPASQANGLPDTLRVTMLADAGHMLIEERPDTVAEALLAAVRA